ncbi:MAG: class I adenylate-forming enzyme family protein [Acidimicrobiia bacterium]
MRIVDDEGNDLPAGETGEILGFGPGMAFGYVDNPAEMARAWDTDGWWHSGDLGVLDDTGHLRVVGRKEMILRGGVNISPLEIEDCSAATPTSSRWPSCPWRTPTCSNELRGGGAQTRRGAHPARALRGSCATRGWRVQAPRTPRAARRTAAHPGSEDRQAHPRREVNSPIDGQVDGVATPRGSVLPDHYLWSVMMLAPLSGRHRGAGPRSARSTGRAGAMQGERQRRWFAEVEF